MSSWEFYGKDYKTNLYVCYPCDARVGTHGKGKKALGTMANKKLRALRMAAHGAFDPMWKNRKRKKNQARRNAYKWLQEQMNLSKYEAHIGRFNEEQCFELLKIMRERNA